MTEFEFMVFNSGKAAADPAMEHGFVLKVIQRFCANREETYDTVLRLHPELPAPKGRV